MNYYELQKVSDLYPVESGSPVHEKKTGTLQKDGTIKLTVVGVDNVFEDIQSYEAETNINNILARAANGDYIGIDSGRGTPVFGDFTNMPSSYFEVLNTVIEGKRYFEKLPVEIKEKFDNDFNKWFASAGENDWFMKMGIVKDETEKAAEEKELEDEQKQ